MKLTLNEALKQQGRTAIQIADALGISSSFLSQMRTGKRPVPDPLRTMIERELNMEIDFDPPVPAQKVPNTAIQRSNHPQKSLTESAEDLTAAVEQILPLLKRVGAGLGAGVTTTALAQSLGGNRGTSLLLGLAIGLVVAATLDEDTPEPEEIGWQ